MRLIRGFGLFIFIGFAVGACFNPPEYPIQPQIEFENLTYKQVDGIDSLVFSIRFKDGDGDLGLGDPDVGCSAGSGNLVCFNNSSYELLQNSAGSYGLIPTGNSCSGTSVCYNRRFYFLKHDRTQISYKDKRTNPEYSSLPGFTKPFNCINWEVTRNANNVVVDTVYFELNDDHYNFEVDFLVKNLDGTFTEFDFTKEFDYPGCSTPYYGRFPVLYKDQSGSPLEGVIKFGIGSPAFKLAFSLKTLKFRIKIRDRALNESNVVESGEFSF